MLDVIPWDRITQNIFIHRALRARSKHQMVPSFTLLCPLSTLIPVPSYHQLSYFTVCLISKQTLKMQADITNLAQASTSNLQFLEPPKGQNGSCREWQLRTSDWKLQEHCEDVGSVWGLEEISWGGKYNARISSRISYKQVKRLQQG